jgi:hypothetical protein
MSEILDRLRQRHAAWQRQTGAIDASIYSWAADEIDRLTEEVARLREENERLRLSERVYSDSCPTEEIP